MLRYFCYFNVLSTQQTYGIPWPTTMMWVLRLHLAGYLMYYGGWMVALGFPRMTWTFPSPCPHQLQGPHCLQSVGTHGLFPQGVLSSQTSCWPITSIRFHLYHQFPYIFIQQSLKQQGKLYIFPIPWHQWGSGKRGINATNSLADPLNTMDKNECYTNLFCNNNL
jgi:hypothetical protein